MPLSPFLLLLLRPKGQKIKLFVKVKLITNWVMQLPIGLPTCPRRLVRAVWCQLYCWFKSLLSFSKGGIWHHFRYVDLTEDQLAVTFLYRLNYWTSTTWELSCEILSNYWLECFVKSWGILTFYKQVFYRSKYCILTGCVQLDINWLTQQRMNTVL